MMIAIDRMILSNVDVKMTTVEEEKLFYAAKGTSPIPESDAIMLVKKNDIIMS